MAIGAQIPPAGAIVTVGQDDANGEGSDGVDVQ